MRESAIIKALSKDKSAIIQALTALVIMVLAGFGTYAINGVNSSIEKLDAKVAAHDDQYHEEKNKLTAKMALVLYKIEQLETDRDIDVEQNRRLAEQKQTDRRFWRLHGFVRDAINMMLAQMGKPLLKWPDLDGND